MPLPYPPPWMDTVTLAEHICVSTNTIDNWVVQGVLPPPRKRGGKLMWRWAEVDERLANGTLASSISDAERMFNHARKDPTSKVR